MKLRTLTRPEDRASVRRIVEATGFFSAEEVDIAAELVTEQLEKGDDSGYHLVFAEEGDVTLGYCCFGPIPATEGSFDVYWIAVAPEGQRRGIGRALLAETERVVRGLGGKRIWIDTSEREQYVPTHRFYESAGYALAARLVDFYRPGEAKVIFRKSV